MSALAGPDLEGEESLREILQPRRETFGMESVALQGAPARERRVDRRRARRAGRRPARRRRFASTSRSAPTCGWSAAARRCSPRTSACSRRSRPPPGPPTRAGGSAARRGRRGRWRPSTGSAPRCWRRSATTCARRSPAIKAAVSSLRQTDVEWSDEEREELLATIEESADRLDAVVGNLLDASRLQAGALSVQLEPVALDEVVAAALLALPGRRPSGSRSTSPRTCRWCSADRGLLQRVLVNVARQRPAPRRRRRAGRGRARAGAESARIEIVDHGPGGRASATSGLFEPFQRLDDRGTEGVGLGLSVARGFVEAMGGAMVADPTPGGGLTMRIRLPLASARERQVR